VPQYARTAPPPSPLPLFARVRVDLGVPVDFPADVVAEAGGVKPAPPSRDETALPFVTIDPPGSMDLDQALHIERLAGGFRVLYAIADVAAFVRPGGAIDGECHRRGETLYSPDIRTPLHPTSLSEGAASLLPGEVRPALLWRVDVDADGNPTSFEVGRALVKSVARLDYPSVQKALDAGTADEVIGLLRDVGRLREAREVDRGGVSLQTPEQQVEELPDGTWTVAYRTPEPVEGWNAQISLLTGMCAARIMLDGGVGIVRTLPPPDDVTVESIRRSAVALGVDWPTGVRYADVIRGLDPANPAHSAVLRLATRLLRGAAYTVVDAPVKGEVPPALMHSAVAAPYAHVTAPLRRLVDRYAGECCVALCAGEAVPDWARAGLAALPEEMRDADHRAHELDRAMVDVVEAALLQHRIGETFDAAVVEAHGDVGEVQLRDPAVRAKCTGGPLPLGTDVTVRLVTADPAKREVTFALAGN
jgi:exoribonuclease R